MALVTDLYPYQEEAVDLAIERGNSLIAYEMGLGKTMVAVSVIEDLLTQPLINFALVIVQSNLRYQWAESIAKFTDVDTEVIKVKGAELTVPTKEWCVVVDGPKKKRHEQYKWVDQNWPNFVIVSYEQVVSDYRSIANLLPDAIVIDEASYIKGFAAQRSKKVKLLGKKAEYRYALTGTPVENRPEELYSIMQFVDPTFLGSFEGFEAKHIVRNQWGGVERYRNLDVLHRKMPAVMSRKTRLDPDVAPYLPEVEYRTETLLLPKKTQALYDRIAAEIQADLATSQMSGDFDIASYYSGDSESDMSEMGKVMAKMLALQMLCNDWTLIRDSAAKHVAGEGGSSYAADLVANGDLDGLEDSSKLEIVRQDVTNMLEQNPKNKVIIFSFFKGMVDRLKAAFPDYDSVIYTGDMNLAAKAAARDKFQKDPDCRLFIATDAGAYGVDLPQANILINFDEVDSAGKMDQRNARHVRAGSEHKNVLTVSYIVDGSIEERRHLRLAKKRQIATATIDGYGADENGVIENDVEGLGAFLAANSLEPEATSL